MSLIINQIDYIPHSKWQTQTVCLYINLLIDRNSNEDLVYGEIDRIYR